MRCPSRNQWRTKFLQDFRKELEKLTTPFDVMNLLLDGVQSVLQDTPAESIVYSTNLEHLATAQLAIGWEQIFRGRLSQQWEIHQQQHLGDNSTNRNNGMTWTTSVADFLLKEFSKLWDLRNQDRHGRDKSTRAAAILLQATREMHQLYEHRDSLPQELSWILAPPIESRLHWSGPLMRAWINTFKPLIEESYPPDVVGD